MRPIDQYATIRRGQVELRRQAEDERMKRAASLKKLMNSNLQRKFACWLGSRLVTWGQKLEHFGTPAKPGPSPHH